MKKCLFPIAHPPRAPLKAALPMLACLLRHHDNEVLTDASWALSYASDGPNERIQEVLDTQALPLLVELLSSSIASVQKSAHAIDQESLISHFGIMRTPKIPYNIIKNTRRTKHRLNCLFPERGLPISER